VTENELYAYLGFNTLMDLNFKPSIEDYWKKDTVYYLISRSIYRDISRYLPFVDNTNLSS